MSRLMEDRGSLTAFVAVFAVTAFLLIALVYEGGRYLEAQRAARHAAVGASRAGAQALSEGAIRRGEPFNALDENEARRRARDYLDNVADIQYPYTYEINASSTQITVEVTVHINMPWLFNASRSATEDGTACAEAGIVSSQGLC